MKKDLLNHKSSDKIWIWAIALAAVISFGLSVFNNYALDDFIVILKNNYTQKGFAGIWKILSKDTFAGMTEANIMVLSGGRYRPLSLVTFAIEHEVFRNLPFISHLINVALYVLIGIFLYKFLKRILAFNNSQKSLTEMKAGLIALLFITLPAHSEPVINIKGRDDLMCLLFFIVSAIQLLKFIRSNNKKHFIYSGIFFFLSLMSKESAVTFVLIFPLLLYFFTDATFSKKITTTFTYVLIMLVFLFFRYLATKDNQGIPSNDIFNNIFINASAGQKFATIFLSWLYYFKLFFFPLHLSYDYNYNQIPLTNFNDWRVLFSIGIHLVLILIAIITFRKKSIYSFAILFYFITFSIFSNLFFNIGTIFADRFILIPSFGLCIIVVVAFFQLIEKIYTVSNQKIIRQTGLAFFITIFFIFGMRSLVRCSDWKNNNTLFLADTVSAPQSAKVQLNAGIAYINLSENKDTIEQDKLLNKAIYHIEKGININPVYVEGYMNMGVAYSRLRNMQTAILWWNKARKMNPTHRNFADYDKLISNYYFVAGLRNGVDQKFQESISNMQIALSYDSLNLDILYNLGGAYFTIQQIDSAKYYFQKVLDKNPSYQKAKDGLSAIGGMGR